MRIACSMISTSSSNGISFSRSIMRSTLRSMSIAGLLYSALSAASPRSGRLSTVPDAAGPVIRTRASPRGIRRSLGRGGRTVHPDQLGRGLRVVRDPVRRAAREHDAVARSEHMRLLAELDADPPGDHHDDLLGVPVAILRRPRRT